MRADRNICEIQKQRNSFALEFFFTLEFFYARIFLPLPRNSRDYLNRCHSSVSREIRCTGCSETSWLNFDTVFQSLKRLKKIAFFERKITLIDIIEQ